MQLADEHRIVSCLAHCLFDVEVHLRSHLQLATVDVTLAHFGTNISLLGKSINKTHQDIGAHEFVLAKRLCARRFARQNLCIATRETSVEKRGKKSIIVFAVRSTRAGAFAASRVERASPSVEIRLRECRAAAALFAQYNSKDRCISTADIT